MEKEAEKAEGRRQMHEGERESRSSKMEVTERQRWRRKARERGRWREWKEQGIKKIFFGEVRVRRVMTRVRR